MDHLPRQVSPKFGRKRLEFLHGAARVFSRLGFHKAALSDVGEELDVTPPALYYYFKSKDQMLYECGQIALQDLRGALDQSVASQTTGLAQLQEFFRRYAEIICDDLGRCLVLTNADDLAEQMREENIDGRRALDREVRQIIRTGIQDGSIKECDAKVLSGLLFGAINPISRWWSPRGPLSPAEVADRYFELVLDGVRGKSARNAPAREIKAEKANPAPKRKATRGRTKQRA